MLKNDYERLKTSLEIVCIRLYDMHHDGYIKAHLGTRSLNEFLIDNHIEVWNEREINMIIDVKSILANEMSMFKEMVSL